MTDQFAHDAPTDESEYEAVFRTGFNYDFAVYVSAVGGGTIGKAYAQNHWHYEVVDYRDNSPTWGQVIGKGSDFYCGSPLTHMEAADAIAGFFETD